MRTMARTFRRDPVIVVIGLSKFGRAWPTHRGTENLGFGFMKGLSPTATNRRRRRGNVNAPRLEVSLFKGFFQTFVDLLKLRYVNLILGSS